MTRTPQPTRRPRERVLVCGAVFPGQAIEAGGPLSEMRSLLEAAGAEVVGPGLVQHRQRPVASTLLGSGKVEEIARAAREHRPDALVVDNDLSPGQVRSLERATGVRVIDRSEVILDIFARRARTRQARLQVELAQVEYLLPRLRRMWTHLERTEGAIGTRGPGETQLETDRRLLRNRVRDLRAQLAEIEARRQREVRSRSDQFTVGLVGYTNAGKSTLLNRLTGSSELVADMLFATLDTRTRQWRLPGGQTVLLSDTVGFLQRLPHHLVASFHATLEEALSADLLLHVVDASHPDVLVQIEAVEGVLAELSSAVRADVLVLNKIDRLDASIEHPALARVELAWRGRELVRVSAATGAGVDRLTEIVARRVDARSALVEFDLPVAEGRLAALVRSLGQVAAEALSPDGERYLLRARVPDPLIGRLRREAAAVGAGLRVLEPARERAQPFDPAGAADPLPPAPSTPSPGPGAEREAPEAGYARRGQA